MNQEIALAHMVEQLTEEDYSCAVKLLGADEHMRPRLWYPDLVLAPDGAPYIYRWYLVGSPSDTQPPASVMLHIQVASDPKRPLHDHPWSNMSVIVSGGYEELLQANPPRGEIERRLRQPGDIIFRGAHEAHRLLLPPSVPYAMTIFSTGPKVRDWGFWYDYEWRHHDRCIATRDGVSIHVDQE
jgi:hypothetical protein